MTFTGASASAVADEDVQIISPEPQASSATNPPSILPSSSATPRFTVSTSRDRTKIPEKLPNQVAKGELYLLSAAVGGNVGYKTLEDMLPALKLVDPSSAIWQKVTMSRQKASYAVSDGLGPHFHDQNMQRARAAPGFSFGLDSATTKRGGLSKDLDIKLVYWDDSKGQVVESLLDIVELTSETAEIMKTEVLMRLEAEGLKLTNVLACSRDNPNVNKKLVRLLEEEVKNAGGHLIDLGSCVLHAGHNSVEKGINCLSVDIPTLVKACYAFFKKSTIRREQFTKELLDLDMEVTYFKRHVDTRWLTLRPAAERVDKNYEAIEKYFLCTLPELAQSGEPNEKSNAKEAMKTKNYEKIVSQLRKPACRTTLRQVMFMCEKFTPFMKQLQSGEPIVHQLHDFCVYLLLELANCIVKEAAIPDSAVKLAKMDLSKEWKSAPKMPSSARDSFSKLSQHNQDTLKQEYFNMFKTTGEYLQKNLAPLTSPLVRYLRALDPAKRGDYKDKGTEPIIKSAKALKRFTPTEIDLLESQWENLLKIPVEEDIKDGKLVGRIDVYYAKIIKQLESNEPGKYAILTRYIKIALSLPSSNSFIERGFSQSKLVLDHRERLSLTSLKGQRDSRDAIRYYGGAAYVPMTPSLLSAHFKAKHEYEKRTEAEKKARIEHEKTVRAETESSRKRTADRDEKARYEAKKAKLEGEAKSLQKELKYLETMLDGMLAKKSTVLEEVQASISASAKLRESMKEKQARYDTVTGEIRKLMETKLNKQKRV